MSDTTQDNQLINVLQSLCLDTDKVDLDENTIKWAMQTGLSSIVFDYGNTQECSDSVIKNLVASKLTSQFWFQTQLNATKVIVQELNKQGIVPTLLKGISISTSYYPKPHYRTMRDIDILVDNDEVESFESILPKLDYEQRSTYSKEFYDSLHHTMPWQHCKDEIWIEVHKRLFPKTSPCCNAPVFQLEVIKKEIVIDDFYGLNISRLSKEFQIVYIATHWAERFKQISGVFALLDIALIINKHDSELDWNKIISWSNTPYVSNYVYLMLQYLKKSELVSSSSNIDKCLKKLNHTLGFGVGSILNAMINYYLMKGGAFSRVLTTDNVALLWKHLLEPSFGVKKIVSIPLAVIFPKNSNKRFDVAFQYSRFKSFLSFKN